MDIALCPKTQMNGRFIGFDYTTTNSGLLGVLYRFLKFFLTPIGTYPNDLEYGTEFGRVLMCSVDFFTLEAIVVQSVNYAVEKLREFDSSRADDDALDSVNIKRIVIDTSGAGATIYLEISNRAGKALTTYVTAGVGNG